jgi:signal transduction histidine kinase
MVPRCQEKILGLFDQLDPQASGTGLGLALVRRMEEAHGGQIWVESGTVGRGAAFCVTCPRRRVFRR